MLFFIKVKPINACFACNLLTTSSHSMPYITHVLLVSPSTIVLCPCVCPHARGSSCAWMPASTSGGYSASALVVEIRSYDAKQYDRYEHPTPTAEGDVDS